MGGRHAPEGGAVSTHRAISLGVALLVLVGLAALLVSLPSGTSVLIDALRVNRHALEATKRLVSAPAAGPEAGAIPATCPDYPTGLQLMHQSGLTPAETLERTDRLAACWPPERAALLAGWRAGALWALGRHQEVCDSLAAVNAAPRMLALAEQSAGAEDWAAVRVYLDCLPRLAGGDAWISPWIVAQLYFGLGQHLERNQALGPAIAAYHAAASWYPTVWATPYQAEAKLLWQQGRNEQAVSLLVDAVSRSTEPSASFQLWRQLGQYWVQRNNNVDALCAYRRAAALVDRLPAGNLSENGRRGLLQEVDVLENAIGEGHQCFDGYPMLHNH
jgi:tetratricopeptide (TPR) repeat protein